MLKLLSNDYARRKAAKKPAQPVRPPAKFGAADLIRKAQKTVVESNFSLPPLFNATETIEEIVARGVSWDRNIVSLPLGARTAQDNDGDVLVYGGRRQATAAQNMRPFR